MSDISALRSQGRLDTLSVRKAELLKLLLEKRSRLARRIRGLQRKEGTNSFPMSWAQQRLWFIDKLEGGSSAYHITSALRLRGDLNMDALQRALNSLIQRHESLRTRFGDVGGELFQRIAPDARFPLRVVDAAQLGKEQLEEYLRDQKRDEAFERFDLAGDLPVRGRLIRIAADEHLLLITMHHIVSDGWSMLVFMRELGELYSDGARGGEDSLAPLSVQYADYAQWQREWLQGDVLERQLDYWRRALDAAPPRLELPTDRARPPVQSYRGAKIPVLLDRKLTTGLRALVQARGVTLFMALSAAWSVLLSRLSGQQDVVIGAPVANRQRPELESLIGFFVNSLALRFQVQPELSVAQLLAQVRETTLSAYDHQDVPFEKVVEAMQPTRSLDRNPIFQVMLSLQSSSPSKLDLQGLDVSVEEHAYETAKFDLLLYLEEQNDAICGTLSYAADLFDRETVERWIACFQVLLEGMVDDPQQRVGDLALLPEEERRRIIEDFNATQSPYPRDRRIHQLFEEQAERTPHALAVVCADAYMTYSRLNARANQLARYLKRLDVGPECLVGVCMDRSIEMIVAMLGILKAGGAYVPLDPGYPAERLRYILEDASPRAILTKTRLLSPIFDGYTAIALDDRSSPVTLEAAGNLGSSACGASSDNLAYVIYTSGSTGKPKGVAIQHRNAVNLICWAESAMGCDTFDQVLHSTSLNFDLSVYEVFVPLATGGTLHVVQNALSLLEEERPVTLINTVPSAMKAIADARRIPRSARVINLAGEPLKEHLVRRIFEVCDVDLVCNLYGPSETTTYSTWISMPRAEGFKNTIGRPIANTRIYILDDRDRPVPIGVVGQICIAGDGVARGYLNRPALTAERFVRDPFSGDESERMYRTGDLGRWRNDGTIEFIGRNDHQVKIRGFRIELGEIEACLLRHSGVKEAAAIAREDACGEKHLLAYVSLAKSGLQAEELRSHLRGFLPEYMVPSAIVMLNELPLTPNGKIDRQALPAPDLGSGFDATYEEPQSEMEQTVAAVWRSLLRVDRVSRHDNFFELGGHSLLIVQMLEQLRRFGLTLELRKVFENPTLSELARALVSATAGPFQVPDSSIPEGSDEITPQMLPLLEIDNEQLQRIVQAVPGGARNIQDIYPLLPLQEGILFHSLFDEKKGDAYVLPLVLRLASRERLDKFVGALRAVIDRHDVLRTAIFWEGLSRPVQVVCRHVSLQVDEVSLDSHRDVSEQIAEWLQPDAQRLDLHRAPLMKLRVAPDPHGAEWYALWQLHHVIDDAASRKILITELAAYMEGRAADLPNPVPYRNHVAQVLAYGRTRSAESFFREKLGDVDEPTAPFGLMEAHEDGSGIREAQEPLDGDLSSRARLQARRLGVTAATLFHAAWSLVVAHASGRDDVVFGSVLLGRLQRPVETQHIVGMFINTLPLRLQLRDISAKDLVERTQHALVELMSHEQASLASAQRCSGVIGSVPLFTTLLNYRHHLPNLEAAWRGTHGISVVGRRTGTNYPITVSIDELESGFRVGVQTDQRLNPERIIGLLKTTLSSLVAALEHAPTSLALALPSLPDSELKLIRRFNATEARYPDAKMIHELFEEQVERTPNAIAVELGEHSMTYAELNVRANRLARFLVGAGVGPDELVGICVERTPDMVVAVLAALKAGGAYVPLDPHYPPERLQFMMEDAASKVVLTQAALKDVLPPMSSRIIVLDQGCDDLLVGYEGSNLGVEERGLSSDNLLYVIYTSGSTGKPKGTAMPHRAMVNLLEWHRRSVLNDPSQRVLQFAALSFDVAFQEIFSTLTTGSTLVLLDEQVRRDVRALAELLRDRSIGRLFIPPVMLQALAEHFASEERPGLKLRDIIAAGEQLRVSAEITGFIKMLDECRLHNHYGPTETHVVTALTLQGDPEEWPALPSIGRPIANASIYILDALRQPVPVGVAGEIWIAGANVARGYLNRPDLTGERFVRDPLGERPGARMYKTGDLGRWLEDGSIEYLGRNDDQVKMRGYRIELGEIEQQLEKHPDVKQVAVVARDGAAGKLLIAYVMLREQSSVRVEELRAHLRSAVPEFMMPSAFVFLESMPLTPSGKLNRRALPAPGVDAYVSDEYEAPKEGVESMLAGIWQDVLGVERVGRRDNFFELGGHSLLVMKVLARIYRDRSCALSAVDVYKNPVLSDLALRVERGVTQDRRIHLSDEARLDEDIVVRERARSSNDGILLTGGTGFVGRFLLSRLLQDTAGTPIYCLVRGKTQHDAHMRLRDELVKWDLWSEECARRLITVAGDLRLPRLGLDERVYQTLSQCVDTVFHCATSMNHLETYDMAKAANVDSARELVRLACAHRPKLINHISTLGVFSACADGAVRTADELTSIEEEEHWNSRGYVASKWVSDQIFTIANRKGVACNIFRLGLVWADSQRGRYDELQREYRIIKSCLASGFGIQGYSYDMAPTPVDYVAKAIAFLGRKHAGGGGVFHIASPDRKVDDLFGRCNEWFERPLQLLPWFDWVQVVKKMHLAGHSLPVVPLIDHVFAMGRRAFEEYQQRLRSRRIRFDCSRTQHELDEAGIAGAGLDDDSIRLCVADMLSRDVGLRQMLGDGVDDFLCVQNRSHFVSSAPTVIHSHQFLR
jgi:amino acid adenylation domain-containing protein/thioester reductase-like protein